MIKFSDYEPNDCVWIGITDDTKQKLEKGEMKINNVKWLYLSNQDIPVALRIDKYLEKSGLYSCVLLLHHKKGL